MLSPELVCNFLDKNLAEKCFKYLEKEYPEMEFFLNEENIFESFEEFVSNWK